VLTTPRLSLPEVGGEAVAYTTEDPDRIATDLAELLHDEQRRVTLAKAGFDRAKEFTWRASAQAHVATWNRVVI
jgi:glycosyltransferase involved in cell wall biosynthesis